MRLAKLMFVASILTAVWCAPAYTQTPAEPTSLPRQPSISQTVSEFDTLMANSDQLRRSTMAPRVPSKSIAPVLVAIPEFRKATEDLREAVSAKKNVRDPLRHIEKLIKPFTEHFKDMKPKPSPFDSEEFKTFTQKDFVWETLTTAERVDNNLQIANLLLRDSQRSSAVTIKTMQFYGEIYSDLERLKWLAGKVATAQSRK